ncbi:MAG: NAD-dependent epimerase/dehydratase family protein [FCB group bacterium]|jgi:UDP-glucose 4-epimerase|nr:NAD-dependent epimerase/dehydratase family protein [FCB group bacterium]
MKILVTGGAGFIGSHVVDSCIREGHDVVIVDNLFSGCRDFVNPLAKFYETDIRHAALADVFAAEKPDAVVHFAAQIEVSRSFNEPMFDAEVNILGSLAVLECCARNGVKKILFASSGGTVYGAPETCNLPASEDCPTKPQSHYGTSKLCVEHYIELYQHLYGLSYTILRFPNVYGPRQNPHGEAGVCAILTGLMLEGKTPTLYGFGEPLRDYVYVGDIARGTLLALEKGNCEILNMGSGKGTSVREIFDTVQRLTGFEGAPILKPKRPGEVQDIYVTGDKAKTVLGWAPEVSFEEGLRRTLEHMKAQSAQV